MTHDELQQVEFNAPIKLSDRKLGLVIRIARDEIGVQVPGEEAIRWLDIQAVKRLEGGALEQK